MKSEWFFLRWLDARGYASTWARACILAGPGQKSLHQSGPSKARERRPFLDRPICQKGRRVVSWWVGALVGGILLCSSTALACGFIDNFECIARGKTSTFWLDRGSIEDRGGGIRRAEIIQDTTFPMEFTNGSKAIVNSVQVVIDLHCLEGRHKVISQAYFSRRFKAGQKIYSEPAEIVLWRRAKVGTIYMKILNEVCARKLSPDIGGSHDSAKSDSLAKVWSST